MERDRSDVSIARRCELLSISRSGFYHTPSGHSAANLALMRLIDEQFMETPFYGSRQMTLHLRRLGHDVGRKRVRRLMRRMGLAAVYQRPRTSVPHPEHRIFPYLLRDLTIERPNHVWCADITYIPMRRGFLYLVAVMDWATRKVLSWRVSNTMDGRGRWLDNVFVERLWRSLKYECVYLHGFETGSELRAALKGWIEFYNTRRPHSAHAGRTPDEAYGLAPPFGSPGHARESQTELLAA